MVAAGQECQGGKNCTAWEQDQFDTFRVNPDGGFFFGPDDVHAIAFKSITGKLSLVVHEDGFVFASKQTPIQLPAVGFTWAYWDMAFLGNGTMTAVVSTVSEVTAVDSAAQSFTRTKTGGVIDTWTINDPVAGVRHRARESATGPSEFLVMPLPDTGVLVGTTLDVPTDPAKLKVSSASQY